jgi:hypothetical protein
MLIWESGLFLPRVCGLKTPDPVGMIVFSGFPRSRFPGVSAEVPHFRVFPEAAFFRQGAAFGKGAAGGLGHRLPDFRHPERGLRHGPGNRGKEEPEVRAEGAEVKPPLLLSMLFQNLKCETGF